jgi:HAD superfamily hydrolase (TIGR01509 family)
MIKLVIFDLDGVLVDSCDLHFTAFNMALSNCGQKDKQISYEEHLLKYNGKPTHVKLAMLSTEKGLDLSNNNSNDIWAAKQIVTKQMIDNYQPDSRIINILKALKNDGYTLFCASNSIWSTLKTILLKKGFLDYLDYFISNEDVKHPKPHPEIYYKCLQRYNVSPQEALIIEDSDIGYSSAVACGAHVLKVENTFDVTYENIVSKIKACNQPPLNIVIPMAGNGSRFYDQGYTLPKPLIQVMGKPMIQWVVENLQFTKENARFIFITRQEHRDKYNIDDFLKSIAPNCSILSVDTVTEGAACTVLLAKEWINNKESLLIANSDQYLEWNPEHFLDKAKQYNVDGLISTFQSTEAKWSYAKEENGYVCEVAEKKPISDKATTGIYYWKHGSDFVQCANAMIEKNIRVKNEFYVCPVFNEAIKQNKKIMTQNCNKMWGLGTPEDLSYFINHFTM